MIRNCFTSGRAFEGMVESSDRSVSGAWGHLSNHDSVRICLPLGPECVGAFARRIAQMKNDDKKGGEFSKSHTVSN